MPTINPRTLVSPTANQAPASPGLPAASLEGLRKPKLDATQAQAAREGLEQLKNSIAQKNVQRALQGTQAPPEEMSAHRQNVGALSQLSPVPNTVAAKRQWVEQNRPVIERGQLAAFALRQEAFFVDRSLQGEADSASAKANKAGALLQRVEEQAGLRRPEPPKDPNRPYRPLATAVEAGRQANPIFRAISPLLTPALATGDLGDALGRSAERKSYPAAMKEYEARLAEYEKARAQ